jgi:hypothetical protein
MMVARIHAIARRSLFCLAIIAALQAETPAVGDIEFFPLKKISENPHASLLRSPSINVLYLYSAETKRHYAGFDFGAKIPALTYHGNEADVELGGMGGIFNRFELFSQSFNFVHADFTGMLYTDVRYRQFLFETSVYHTSSHVGDDHIKYHHAAVRNTGLEAARHHVSYILPFADISVGFEYKFSRRPKNTIIGNPSIFLGNRIDLLRAGFPVFIEWEAEFIAGPHLPNIGIRAGIYLRYLFNTVFLGNDSKGKESHELSVYYYYGYSKMGVFSRQRESLILFGPTYRY